MSAAPTIFVSYRRGDSAGHTGRLFDRLAAQFGDSRVFMDVSDLDAGADFVAALERAVADADTLLVVIGRDWAGARPDGTLRIDASDDFVRREVAVALARGVRVIPVLVAGAAMPAEHALPDELRALARRQAVELRDARWDADVAALLASLGAGTAPAAPAAGRGIPAGIWIAAALAVAGAVGFIWRGAAPPLPVAPAAPMQHTFEATGTWKRANGSRWLIVQQGSRLQIEEVHYDSGQVWMRGTGEIRDGRIDWTLDHVFGGELRYTGTLAASADGRTLSGTLRNPRSGAQELLVLTRE